MHGWNYGSRSEIDQARLPWAIFRSAKQLPGIIIDADEWFHNKWMNGSTTNGEIYRIYLDIHYLKFEVIYVTACATTRYRTHKHYVNLRDVNSRHGFAQPLYCRWVPCPSLTSSLGRISYVRPIRCKPNRQLRQVVVMS